MTAVRKNRGEVVEISSRRKVGRPSIYSAELAAEICREIASGKSLRAVCDLAGMPTRRTVENWLASDAEFIRQYAHARQRQADHFAAEIVEIVDAPLPTDPQAAYVELGNRKLRTDSRKWIASKLAPKRYGRDGVLGDGINGLDLSKLGDDDLAALVTAVGQERESRGGTADNEPEPTAQWAARLLGDETTARLPNSGELVDRPPRETRAEWLERQRSEQAARAAELIGKLGYLKDTPAETSEFPIMDRLAGLDAATTKKE